MDTQKNELPIQKSQSWKMFDRISNKYDILNRILSLGMDIAWRKKLLQLLPRKNDLKILDLATGTADVLLYFFKPGLNISKAYGVDLAENMLSLGRKKIEQKGLSNRITLLKGDAENIPFDNNTFDCVSIAFGIRNMENTGRVLREMFRVLNKNGRALILEFSLPQNKVLRKFYLFYLRNFVPIIGYLVSHNYDAYKYLDQTIESFPYGEKFCKLMLEAGFRNVKYSSLTLGVVTIYQGDNV